MIALSSSRPGVEACNNGRSSRIKTLYFSRSGPLMNMNSLQVITTIAKQLVLELAIEDTQIDMVYGFDLLKTKLIARSNDYNEQYAAEFGR